MVDGEYWWINTIPIFVEYEISEEKRLCAVVYMYVYVSYMYM